MITLDLTDDEAAAVAVALVMLIQDVQVDGPAHKRWRTAASDVAARLEIERDRPKETW